MFSLWSGVHGDACRDGVTVRGERQQSPVRSDGTVCSVDAGGRDARRGVQYAEGPGVAVADRQLRRRDDRGISGRVSVDPRSDRAGHSEARRDEHRRPFGADKLAPLDDISPEAMRRPCDRLAACRSAVRPEARANGEIRTWLRLEGRNNVMDEKNHRKTGTGTYRVRGMSRHLYRAARLRAASQGTTLRRVVLEALQAYSAGAWTPPDTPPPSRTNGI